MPVTLPETVDGSWPALSVSTLTACRAARLGVGAVRRERLAACHTKSIGAGGAALFLCGLGVAGCLALWRAIDTPSPPGVDSLMHKAFAAAAGLGRPTGAVTRLTAASAEHIAVDTPNRLSRLNGARTGRRKWRIGVASEPASKAPVRYRVLALEGVTLSNCLAV